LRTTHLDIGVVDDSYNLFKGVFLGGCTVITIYVDFKPGEFGMPARFGAA
jgi:hypothetical protein